MTLLSGALQSLLGGLGVVVVVAAVTWFWQSFKQFKQMNKSLNRLCDQMDAAINRIDKLEERVETLERNN